MWASFAFTPGKQACTGAHTPRRIVEWAAMPRLKSFSRTSSFTRIAGISFYNQTVMVVDRFDKRKILNEMLCNLCLRCDRLIYAFNPWSGPGFCRSCAKKWYALREETSRGVYYRIMHRDHEQYSFVREKALTTWKTFTAQEDFLMSMGFKAYLGSRR